MAKGGHLCGERLGPRQALRNAQHDRPLVAVARCGVSSRSRSTGPRSLAGRRTWCAGAGPSTPRSGRIAVPPRRRSGSRCRLAAKWGRGRQVRAVAFARALPAPAPRAGWLGRRRCLGRLDGVRAPPMRSDGGRWGRGQGGGSDERGLEAPEIAAVRWAPRSRAMWFAERKRRGAWVPAVSSSVEAPPRTEREGTPSASAQ